MVSLKHVDQTHEHVDKCVLGDLELTANTRDENSIHM